MGNDEFSNVAIELVAKNLNTKPENIYIVWLTKVLGNNKAMLSTTFKDGLYFEVTYNGNAEEFYVDKYKKESNRCVKYSK